MTDRIRTTTILEMLLAVDAKLEAVVDAMPISPDTSKKVGYFFLGFYTDLTQEYVRLVGKVNDQFLTFSGAGPSTRDEEYVFLVRVATNIKGKTGRQVVTRLKELVDIIEISFRDQVTGIPILPDVPGIVTRGGIDRHELDGATGDSGAFAVADVYIRFHAKI